MHNKIVNKSIPATAAGVEDLESLLIALTRTIEEDFIILLPEPTNRFEPYSIKYYFKAGVFAFAGGFESLGKFK